MTSKLTRCQNRLVQTQQGILFKQKQIHTLHHDCIYYKCELAKFSQNFSIFLFAKIFCGRYFTNSFLCSIMGKFSDLLNS